MIEFNRLNEAATLNYNNHDTKVMVDFIQSTFGIEVSVTGGSQGADIIYSKDKDPVTSFMILIDRSDTYYLINATEKMMSDYLQTKRWKASNTTKLTYKAARAIKTHEVGGYIDIQYDREKAYESLTDWLKSVGIHPTTSKVTKVSSMEPQIVIN